MLDNQNNMNELPIDFTRLEKIDFYGCADLFEPDRVYLNSNAQLVAFISSEKIDELKRILKASAEKYYVDHRPLFFSMGIEIQSLIDSHDWELSSFQKGKNFFRTCIRLLYSGFGIYGLVTILMQNFGEDSIKIVDSMCNRINAANMANIIGDLKQSNYFCEKDNQYIEGVEIGFGKVDNICDCIIYGSHENMPIRMQSTIEEVLYKLIIIEQMFKNGNQLNSPEHKNIASRYLSKVNQVFHENFEKQIKYNIKHGPPQDNTEILFIRKYINFLVLSYRWMNATINLFDCGNLDCLKIASPTNQERYYLTKADAIALTNQLSFKVSVEVNRYLIQFNIEIATNDFINQCLNKNNIEIGNLTTQTEKIGQQMEELEEKCQKFLGNISEKIVGIPNNAVEIKNGFDYETARDFINIISQHEKLETKQQMIKDKLFEKKEFGEMFYLHLQLQLIKKYFSNYSAIILTIKTNESEKLYNVQILV